MPAKAKTYNHGCASVGECQMEAVAKGYRTTAPGFGPTQTKIPYGKAQAAGSAETERRLKEQQIMEMLKAAEERE